MVEKHEFLDIFHLLVQRHFQLLEYLLDHSGADYLVAVEGPANVLVITLAGWLAYVVKQCGPPQPQAGLCPDFFLEAVSSLDGGVVVQTAFCNGLQLVSGNIVQDLEGVGEIVLVALSVHGLDALELAELGEYIFEQPRPVHQFECHRRLPAQKHLVQFLGYSFLRENAHPVLHLPHCRQ